MPADEVERLRSKLPEQVLLVIDAAYAEYVPRNEYEPGVQMVDANPNGVMTRPFYKIYGLAAPHIGWASFPSTVADVLNRVRGPFHGNASPHPAGAAALSDGAQPPR